jgi:hypothetical protein
MSAHGHYILTKLTNGAEVGLKHAVNGNDFHTIPTGAAQSGAVVENGSWFVVVNSAGDYYKTNDGKTWALDNTLAGKYDSHFVRTAKYPSDGKYLVHGKLKNGAHVGLTRTVAASGTDYVTEPIGGGVTAAIVENGTLFMVKSAANHYYKTSDGKTWTKEEAATGQYDHHFPHTPKWPSSGAWLYLGMLKGNIGVGIKTEVSGNDFATHPHGAAITGAVVENGTWFVVKNSGGDYYKTNDGKTWAKDNSLAGRYDNLFVLTSKYPASAYWVHGFLTNGAEVGLKTAVKDGTDYHTVQVGGGVTGAIVENGTWFVVKTSVAHYYKTNDGKTWAQDQSIAGKYDHHFVRTDKHPEGGVWVTGRLKSGAEVALTRNPSGHDFHTVPAGAAVTGAVVENGTWFVVKNSGGDYYKTNDGKTWAKDNSLAGRYDGQFPQTDRSRGHHTVG